MKTCRCDIKANQSGFTLIEIIVAMTILAIAMGAVIKTAAQHTSNSAYLRDRTIAHWVAMNKLAELRISKAFPPKGEEKGSIPMANKDWYWVIKVTETPEETIRRVDIEVKAEEGKQTITSLIGYLGKPL
jgi:general secretion pathway protein I